MSDELLIKLSKAEKRALRILAAFGEVSMGEHIRQEIREKWDQYFPTTPLGQEPKKKEGHHEKAED